MASLSQQCLCSPAARPAQRPLCTRLQRTRHIAHAKVGLPEPGRARSRRARA